MVLPIYKARACKLSSLPTQADNWNEELGMWTFNPYKTFSTSALWCTGGNEKVGRDMKQCFLWSRYPFMENATLFKYYHKRQVMLSLWRSSREWWDCSHLEVHCPFNKGNFSSVMDSVTLPEYVSFIFT